MDKKTFDHFFSSYAQNVDSADSVSLFWRLSDALIMEIIKKEIGTRCKESSLICDAGGGTGRWVVKMSQEIKGKFLIFDRSKDMLTKAAKNVSRAGMGHRVTLVEGDLTCMSQISDNSIDHIVSIYSPISFIYKTSKAAREMYRVLKKNGRILIMGHGYYNSLYSKINNYHAGGEELRRLECYRKIKWSSHVPELITFSMEDMENLLATAGFRIERTYGVPVLVQPGPEDFDPENKKISGTSRYLSNPDIFKQIFAMEMQINSMPTVANRGMNIFTLASKL